MSADETPVDGGEPSRRRRLEQLRTRGEDLDYRFTLANERTFLAWVRTALALIAAGVAVVRFVPGLDVVRVALGFLLVALGGTVAAMSWRHWFDTELAMRRGLPLAPSLVPRLMAAALVLTAAAAVALLVAGLR